MKTLKLFIPVSLLLLIGSATHACGPWYYSAADNRIYRLLPPLWESPTSAMDDFEAKNIMAWSRQTGCTDTAAIRQALYSGWHRFSDWERFLHEMTITHTAKHNPMANNAFCRRLVLTADTDAVRLLFWSKKYSAIRNSQRSPWYYNSGINSNETVMLRAMYNELLHYTPTKRYADRYRFLALKCAWALGDDSTVVAIWKRSKLNRKGNLFYHEAMDYAARSLTRMGPQAEADALYSKNNDYIQLIPNGAKLSTQLRIMLQVCPNSPDIAPLLQYCLSGLDRQQAASYDWSVYADTSDIDSLLAVARMALDNPKVRRKAMWRYTAACILDYTGKSDEALAMLEGAGGGDGDAFLRKSVRILTFYLRSRTEFITDDFVDYAVREVRWIDREMEREWRQLPDSIQHKISHVLNWHWIGELNSLYTYSALRRIVLEDSVGLAWKLSRCGYDVRALQMANLADNRVIDLTENSDINHLRVCPDGIYTIWYTSDDGQHYETILTTLADTALLDGHNFSYYLDSENGHDYSNGLFCLADRMSADALERYRKSIVRPRDNDDRWFNAHSYTNMDYWQDIVGTHYLRERKYKSAALHLKYLSPHYQRLMNIRCLIDPFSIDRSATSHDSTRYKYHFACKMDSLQRIMLRESDPDCRGLAMLEYSIGLENSVGMCWWLTSYGKGWTGPDLTDIDTTALGKRAKNAAMIIRKKALHLLCSEDARARYHLRLGQYSVVRKHYSDTPTGQLMALLCDQRSLYSTTPNFRQPTGWRCYPIAAASCM